MMLSVFVSSIAVGPGDFALLGIAGYILFRDLD